MQQYLLQMFVLVYVRMHRHEPSYGEQNIFFDGLRLKKYLGANLKAACDIFVEGVQVLN